MFALLFWNAPAGGMEFTKNTVRRGIVIRATGPIEIGDAAKLRRIASEATVDERGLRRIVLESPGGNVAEAIRIGTIIRNSNFVTLVGGECASACAMVFYPAGRYFVLLDGGKLGFHSCYDQNLIERPECTELIARFAGSNGFPYGIDKSICRLGRPDQNALDHECSCLLLRHGTSCRRSRAYYCFNPMPFGSSRSYQW